MDNMAPRSKPRVKHRSSINSKGLKNKVETRRVFATGEGEKQHKDREEN